MSIRRRSLIVAASALAACCGGSPSAPSTPLQTSTAQTAVASVLSQATTQLAVVGGAPSAGIVTLACAGGGSMTITLGGTPPPSGNTFSLSSRTDFNNCRTDQVTINGDPFLQSASQYVISGSGTSGSAMTTTTMTGGLRFDSNGVQGRVQFNCTSVITVALTSTPSPASIAWSGTMTWEQPLGSTPVAKACGPAA